MQRESDRTPILPRRHRQLGAIPPERTIPHLITKLSANARDEKIARDAWVKLYFCDGERVRAGHHAAIRAKRIPPTPSTREARTLGAVVSDAEL